MEKNLKERVALIIGMQKRIDFALSALASGALKIDDRFKSLENIRKTSTVIHDAYQHMLGVFDWNEDDPTKPLKKYNEDWQEVIEKAEKQSSM